MPVFFNVGTSMLQSIQNTSQFTRMPVQMAAQQVKYYDYYSRWKQKYSKLKWEPNMGDYIVGIVPQYSPKSRQYATPANLTAQGQRNVVSQYERNNAGRPKHEYFESFQFNWIPTELDFRTGQVAFANKDLTRQVAFFYDDFTRWNVVNYAPYIYVVGNRTAGEGPYIPCVNGEPTSSSSPKNAAFWQAMGDKVGVNEAGFLNFKNIVAVRDAAESIAGIMPWDGMPGKPGNNEIQRGKWMLTGEAGIYNALQFDTHVLNVKPLDMNLLNQGFQGVISSNINFLQEWNGGALRFDVDGSFPAPEIESELADVTYGTSENYETMTNPSYAKAPYAVAVFEGNEAGQDLPVGPPPAPFSEQNISAAKFIKMRWNGEVQLTDQVLLNYGSNVYDTNKYGEYVQLISHVTVGYISKTARNAIPVVYRRNLYSSLTTTV